MLNRSFHGSKKVLGVMCAIVVIGMFMTLTGEGKTGSMLMSTLAWAAITYVYYRVKSN